MFKKISILAAMFVALFAFNACDPTVNPEPDKPDAIVLLQATSIDATTVGLRITSSPSETNALFDGYYLKITPGTFPVEKIPVSSKNLYSVTGLSEGTEYTFSVYAKYTSGEVSPDVSVKWSPATRYSSEIKVYEFTSSLGSGLNLHDYEGTPKTLTIGFASKWDICLDTREGVYVIGSPKASNYTDNDYKFTANGQYARDLDVYKVFEGYDNLNEVFDTKAINEYSNPTQNVYDFTSRTTGFVMAVKTYPVTGSSYYAKVLVESNNGKILQGTAPNRYVQLKVSYQKVASIPYAVFGRSNVASKVVKFNNNSTK